jgi:hypothetical protein
MANSSAAIDAHRPIQSLVHLAEGKLQTNRSTFQFIRYGRMTGDSDLTVAALL